MINCDCEEKQYLIFNDEGYLYCINCKMEDTGEH